MNHKVHWFISGCLTLKFSGSWNTVISSDSVYFGPDVPFSPLSPFGEIGIVSRGTCVEPDTVPVATEAMFG